MSLLNLVRRRPVVTATAAALREAAQERIDREAAAPVLASGTLRRATVAAARAGRAA